MREFFMLCIAVLALGTLAACGSSHIVDPAIAAEAEARGKLSANHPTKAELEAGYAEAGISNPPKWAREVDECRPYPEDDPGFAKLRRELTKYDPAAGVVNSIVELLTLP